MLDRLAHHKDQNDAESRKEVQRIIVNESRKKRKQIRSTLGKIRSLPASKVATISEDGGRVVHSDKVNVHAALKEHLGNRLQTAHDSPITKGQILQYLGHLANTDAADNILHGRYRYPEDTEEGTELLLREATHLYAKNKGIVKYILKDNEFSSFWNSTREATESSKSGIHFGHYIAQSFSPFLTKLQVIKLNLVLSMGMPLKRWLHGLTVLLEKEQGNTNIERLRAICLFEVDLNWVLKVIFAKRMMANAQENDLVPPELFVTAESNTIRATLVKVLYTNICRTQHRNHGVASVDNGQCYDAVGHALCSLALQSFGVPRKPIVLMLIALQAMNFWLRTAFGKSAEAFGGTTDNPFYGISQGSGSAPTSYIATLTLALEAYKQRNFHSTLRSAITGSLLSLAAILFVDDTNQLHLSKTDQSEEHFM